MSATIMQAMEQYLQDPASNLNTDASVATYRSTLRSFASHVDDKPIDRVKERDLVSFLTSRDVSDTTLAAYRDRLRSFFGWAEWKRLTPSDPSRHLTRAVPAKPKPVVQHNWLSEAEIGKVLSLVPDDLMGQRDELVLRFGFTMGLRRSEIVNLHWDMVNLAEQRIELVGKDRKTAQVYIPTKTADRLSAWGELHGEGPVIVPFRRFVFFDTRPPVIEPLWGEWLSGQSVSRVCERYTAASGIKFAPHDMRRSFAGVMEEAVGLEATSKAMRHEHLQTTQGYLKKRQDGAFQALKGSGVDL